MNRYWINPEPHNAPDTYEEGIEKSAYLVDVLDRIERVESILELGCNVGRNLAYLRSGYGCRLHGIEINEQAAMTARNKGLAVVCDNIETADYPITELIFTMAVLTHIPDADLPAVVRKINSSAARYLITIEDEFENETGRHYPRNYAEVFSGEWKQIYYDIPSPSNLMTRLRKRLGLRVKSVPGLNRNYRTRVFRKVSFS